MKKLLLLLLFLYGFCKINAQSNEDIAKVYIKRANEAIENSIDYKTALEYFNKAINYMDTITDYRIASLGSIIYFEVHNKRENLEEQLEFLKKSKTYSKQYFNLYKNKSTEEYTNNVENFILIKETISNLENKIKKVEEDRVNKENELRKIDSLKTVWYKMCKEFTIQVDSIYPFTKDKVALYRNNGYFGILNDLGEIVLHAKEYKDALSFDSYFVLKNNPQEPTKIYVYATLTHTGFLLPNVSNFNPLSTHYGQVMLPRANGRLVCYPNNSYQPIVYDLINQKEVKVANEKELFKDLKKGEFIDKYNKDGEIKINKKWYTFGGHLGGGIFTLYFDKNYNVHSFLCSIDGNILMADTGYEFIGAFYNGKFQVINNGKTFWINQNGTKVRQAKDKSGVYKGNSSVERITNKEYQIKKNGLLVLGNNKLEKLPEFLRKHSKN